MMLHYYIHGRGRGHASRSVPVVDALRKQGHTVRVFAGEAAEPLFPGADPIVSTPIGAGPRALAVIGKRVRACFAATKDDDAKIVITDGDLPSAAAGKLTRVPTIAVGHGLVFAHCKRVEGAPRDAWRREGVKARLASAGATRFIAVNFAPVEPLDSKRTRVAAPTLRGSLGEREAPGNEVLCYFRDDNGDTLAQWLVELDVEPVLFTKRDIELPGVRVEPFDQARFAAALRRARAVVSSAGSQLISECTALGVPQFALHGDSDDEQQLNIAMLRRFEMGGGASFEEVRQGMLARFLDEPPADDNRPAMPDLVEVMLDAVSELG